MSTDFQVSYIYSNPLPNGLDGAKFYDFQSLEAAKDCFNELVRKHEHENDLIFLLEDMLTGKTLYSHYTECTEYDR